jgi:hypothetical protein
MLDDWPEVRFSFFLVFVLDASHVVPLIFLFSRITRAGLAVNLRPARLWTGPRPARDRPMTCLTGAFVHLAVVVGTVYPQAYVVFVFSHMSFGVWKD